MCGPAGSCDHDEGKRKTTVTRLFKGIGYTNKVTNELLIKKIWFKVEPLPTDDERYFITVKLKDAKNLNTLGGTFWS